MKCLKIAYKSKNTHGHGFFKILFVLEKPSGREFLSSWTCILDTNFVIFGIPEASKAKDAFYTAEKEVKEIEGIIPEIKEKIADTKDMQTETIKKIGDKRLNLVAEASSATENGDTLEGSGTSQKATTILTVKKRKTTEDHGANGEGEKSPAKKSRCLDS